MHSAFFRSVFGPWNSSSKSRQQQEWRRLYWFYAAVLPAVLYLFEALKIISYAVTRAPNVNLITQLAMMFVFYGVWVFVPRLCWWIAEQTTNSGTASKLGTLIWFGGLGLLLSMLHLLFLSFILRVMHSPPGWGISHLLQSLGEVWLGNAGQWFLAYAIAATIILYVFLRRRQTAPQRYEVRQNGKTLSIPFADIYWVKAAGNYAELYTARGVMMVRKTLAQIIRDFDGGGFVKAHRGALINGRHVLAIKPDEDGSSFIVQLTNGDEAPLSRRELSTFRKLIKSVQ